MYSLRNWVLSLILASVAVSSSSCAAHSALSASFNGKGLTALEYQGWNYAGYGDFRVLGVDLVTSSGEKRAASLLAKTAFDFSQHRFTAKYVWGDISVTYKISGSQLEVSMKTTNDSADTISGVAYEVLGLKLPTKPREYDGVTPILGFNMGEPTILRLTHGKSVVYLANTEPKPLLVGFPWALDRPASTLFPLRINTNRDSMYPDSLPVIRRPISPHSSDTYRITISFEHATPEPSVFQAEMYREFARHYPAMLEWKNRGPVGQLILSTSAARSRTNPRGWFNDPTVDITTPAGLADFHRRVLEWADRSASYLRNLGAQGMITWDMEGEEFTQPISYIGDPRLLSRLAPEMDSVANAYFKKFTDNGFLVGICIRPQELVFNQKGEGVNQVESKDATRTLMEKVKYARERWGARLFYIDSNGIPGFPLDVQVIRAVAKAYPDVLLIPEHHNLAYYSASAPYTELRTGFVSTSELVRQIYPKAFSVINVTDGAIDQSFNLVAGAVDRGDALLARAWFADPMIDKINAIYSMKGK